MAIHITITSKEKREKQTNSLTDNVIAEHAQKFDSKDCIVTNEAKITQEIRFFKILFLILVLSRKKLQIKR